MGNVKQEEKQERKNLIITFRVFQAIFFGVFALGLSLISGDITGAFEVPVSNFSMTTTIFGLLGAIITGILSKQCENW
jgi:hypothetical protein